MKKKISIIMIVLITMLSLVSCQKESLLRPANTAPYSMCTYYTLIADNNFPYDCIRFTFIGNNKYHLTVLSINNGVVIDTAIYTLQTMTLTTHSVQKCYPSDIQQ